MVSSLRRGRPGEGTLYRRLRVCEAIGFSAELESKDACRRDWIASAVCSIRVRSTVIAFIRPLSPPFWIPRAVYIAAIRRRML